MKEIVTFDHTEFPVPQWEEDTPEGIQIAELFTKWFGQMRGVADLSDPCPEVGGWMIWFAVGESKFACFINATYLGEPRVLHWAAAVSERRGLLARLRKPKVQSQHHLDLLQARHRQLSAEESVTDIRWWSSEDYLAEVDKPGTRQGTDSP